MGIDTAAKKVQINKLVSSQLPSFVVDDNPLFVDFLKQYYISQENQGGSIDIITNFNDYQKSETYSETSNLIGFSTCTSHVNSYDATINVSSTEGWPADYGLLKIDNEIITYTGKTATSFTGCVRGFCGVDNLKDPNNPETLVFSNTSASKHENNSKVINLSNLFLQEFWQKTKKLFLPGFEDRKLHDSVDKANFLRQAKDFYATKGTDEAIKILFGVLFNSTAEVIKPIEYLFAPSDADYVKTFDLIAERLSGNADNVVGQTLFQTDNTATSGSIFNTQYFPRDGRHYYIISLSKGSTVGEFYPTGSSSLVNAVGIGSTVITVDSTLGFPESGSVYVGAGLTVGIATYTSKSSNQFFGVTGISSNYSDSDFVRSSATVYAYENGDVTKPVYFRLTNVANDANIEDVGFLFEGDDILPRQLGRVSDKANVHLNSWIHNIRTKSDVARDILTNTSKVNANSSVVTTISPHLLNENDIVRLLDVTNDDQNPDNVEGTVKRSLTDLEFEIDITSGTLDPTKLYKVQRDLNYAKSSNNVLGISDFVSDIQNTYTSKDNKEVYVTCGSLPSYEIFSDTRRKEFISADNAFNSDVDGVTDIITINNHNFLQGELVRYAPLVSPGRTVVGLDTGSKYAVTKVDDNRIRLSRSVADVAAGKYISILGVGNTTTHELIPADLTGKNVKYQNFLRKFPITPEPKESEVELKNEPIGMLINGVELISNQSGDSLHYGPIEHIDVESGGDGYDVITPPNIHITDNVGTGATAYAVVEGSFKGIEVISGGYDLKQVPNVAITGGNGQGATASARLKATRNSRLFDAKTDVAITATGTPGTINFIDDHLFFDGESVVYEKSAANAVVGGLVDKSVYYVNKINDTQISLMANVDDAVAGINSITISSKSLGSHKFTSTVTRNVLDKIVVDNAGSGYSNRKILVNSVSDPLPSYYDRNNLKSGISTANSYIFSKMHGFKSGDVVEYRHTGTAIGGLHTTQNYQVIVLDEDRFRVCSAGIGTTTTTQNYHKGLYVDLETVGVGTHTFKYPDIAVSLETLSGLAVTSISAPVIRPLCHGSITDIRLTSTGVGYGTDATLNAHRRPLVTISNGQDGLITVNQTGGKITGAFVKIAGKGYVTPPELIVEGEGRYAKLLSNLDDEGRLSSVNIIDGGKDYKDQPATTVRVKQQGSGAVFRADLKQWRTTTVNRYSKSINQDDDGIIIPSQNTEYGLKFVSTYLPRKLRLQLDDNLFVDINGQLKENTQLVHSPIIGWAYDGCPIYGPYGYDTPTGGIIRRITSSYTANTKSDRPPVSTEYPLGFFVEDFDYTADGDLDEYNGRFCKTPEFPDGVYAYFCTISDANGTSSPFIGSREPVFPYILNGFRFKKIEMNGKPLSLQNMSILNSGDILRNTLPYKLGFLASDYDYFVSDSIEDTELFVKTIATSGISSVNILSPGVEYKVGDRVVFDNAGSGGSGASAKVKTLVGSGITEITYNQTTIDHIAFDYKNGVGVGVGSTSHGLQDGDLVNLSGIGTGELRFLEGPTTISISSVTSTLGFALTSRTTGNNHTTATGDNAWIYLTDIVGGNSDDDIVVGDWLRIDGIKDGWSSERLRVLEVDETLNRYRVWRQPGINTTFPAGTRLSVDQRRFTFNVGIQTDLPIILDKLITFNPQNSIGIGTVIKTESGPFGNVQVARVVAKDNTVLFDHDPQNRPHNGQPGSNADNVISLPNHGFLTGQRLKYGKSLQGTTLTVSNNVGLANSFPLVDGQYVYAVKKSNDLLGLSTTRTGIGSTGVSLYFSTHQIENTLTDHTLETTNEQHKGTLDRYDVLVYNSSVHNLRTKDKITVDLAPNTTVSKTIEYDSIARKTIVDPEYFRSSDVSVVDSTIQLTNAAGNVIDHGFKDGDKVLYRSGTSPVVPLTDRGEYYVKRISRTKFRLFNNRKDSLSIPIAFINITNAGSSAGAGGFHRISRINPPIQVMKGETIGFGISDTSLTDFKLEFYKDQNYTNKFNGVGISTEIVRTGVAGTTGSIVNVKITNNLPLPLYYKLVPTSLNTIDVTKRDSKVDTEVINAGQITIDPSIYAGNFGITTTGITSFSYQVPYKPERSSYIKSGITTFRYLTSSTHATGGINEVKIDFPGVDYFKNPGVSTVRTTTGRDANLSMFDDTLGRPGFKEMVKIGYDYPTDKSLSPRADTPVHVAVKNNYVIGHIGVETSGRNYSTPPDLFFPSRPNAKTEVSLEGTGIGSVRILYDSLTGFDLVPNPPRIIPINNSNGVGVVTATSNGVTQFITLKSPLGGWRPEAHRLGTNFPFEVGDEIFVENVNIQGHPDANDGTVFLEPVPSTDPRTYNEGEIQGYNSNMYDYRTFTILSRNIADSRITYSLTGIGSTGGFFDPTNSAGRIIKKEDLPTFNVRFDHRDFINGEPVTFGNGSAKAQMVKNEGWDPSTNSFRLRDLTRTPYIGDVIVGKISNASGNVVKSSYYERFFSLSHQAERVKGWQKDTGKLSNDFQKLQDSDYYQNFSYSIQSEVQEKDFSDAVDSILHPTGYKNFSDLVIKSRATPGYARSTTLTARSPQNATDLLVNIDKVHSFFVKNDYDFATETTISTGLSKFISFQNRKIRDLLSIATAKVELIDDISNQFNAKSQTFMGIHIFKRATTNGISIQSGGTGELTAISGTSYNPATGVLKIKTLTNHGLNNGATIRLANNSLIFTCDKDNHQTEHPYPRSSDPASGENLTISNKTANTFEVTVNTPIVGGQIVGLSSFRLTSQSGAVPLFSNEFDPNDSTVVSVGSSIIRLNNHGFQTGERIKYDPGSGTYGNNRIGIVATNDVLGGVSTDFMPSEMYVVSRLDQNRFKVAGLSTTTTDEAFTLRSLGSGTEHSFDSTNAATKSLIQIDNTIQSPLYNRSVSVGLSDAIAVGVNTIKVVGITSIKLNDIVNIDNELIRIKTVGVGATNVITVDRGILGTKAAAHSVGAACTMKGGNYNIVKDVIYFATPPWGPTGDVGVSTQSSFSGRVFNRKDQTRNFVFDDVSHKFTGNVATGRTFTLTQNGGDVTGIVTTTSGSGGSDEVINYGVLMINGVFQRPGVDYEIVPRSTAPNVGVGGSVIFTGDTLYDLPRGGKVDEVTIATGQNYQPRVAAAATAVINAAGSIQSVTMLAAGSGYQSGPVNVEIFNPLGVGSDAKLQATVGTGSSAGMITGITTISGGTGYSSADPAHNTHIPVVSTTGTSLTINVGTALPKGRYQHTFVRDSGTHTFVSATTDCILTGGTNLTPNGATYIPTTGVLTLTFASAHGLSSGNIQIAEKGLTFTCDADNHATNHSYPRSSDPAYNTNLAITVINSTSFSVNVGKVKGVNSVVTDTTAVAGSGSTAAFTPSTAVYDPNSGDLVLTKASGTWTHATNAGTLTPISGTAYNPSTGILTVKATGHGLVNNDLINILEGALPFTCAKDSHATRHYYPRKTDPIFGKWIKITKVDNDTFTVWVGGSTYTGAHTFVTGQSANKIRKATSYVRLNDNSFVFTCTKDGNTTQHSYPRTHSTVLPTIKVGIATGYSGLSVTGGSGSGLKVDATVSTSGVIKDVNITERGFGYKNGEVLTVQGIPFRAGVSTSPFTLTIKTTITDQFSGYSFGQLVPLDDFSSEFNGVKKTFLLTKTVLTKDVVTIASLDTSILPENNLLIFLNDVLQQPKENYRLEGGTTVIFVEAPKSGSKLQILFYRGGNQDIEALNPVETVKVGDKIQLLRDNDVPTQTDRVVSEIKDISKIETPPYGGGGISTNPTLLRVAAWKKQEHDLIVDGLPIAKDRPLQVGNFYPSSRLIRSVGVTSVVTYVDNAFPLFSAYDNRTNTDKIPGQIQIVNTQEINVATGLATVGSAGTVSSISIVSGGSGYENIPTVSIAKFNRLQSGLGTSLFVNVPLTREIGRGWTKVNSDTDINYNDIDYIPEGVFVAVGSTSGINTSTTGIGWSSASVTGTYGQLNGVVGLKSEVVAVGAAGTITISTTKGATFGPTTIYRRTQVGFIPTYNHENISQNLNAAAVGSYLFPNALTGIATDVPYERTVVVGAAGTILYSEPGTAGISTSFIVANKYASAEFFGVGYNEGTFIAVGNGGALYRSTDGEVWSGVTTTAITTRFNDITYADGKWVAVGAAGSIINSNDDGLTWSVVNGGSTGLLNNKSFKAISYQENVWVAVGQQGYVLNSSNGMDWQQKRIKNAGTIVNKTFNGLAFGDQKLVAVGLTSSICWSESETVGAAATATVGAGGTISAITVNDGGFGYTPNTNPTVLLSQQSVTRETCNTVTVKGDYGVITAVAYDTTGPNSKHAIELTLDSDAFLNQAAFGNIARSQIAVGDYFVVRGSRVGTAGTGPTTIDKDGNIVGQGTTMIDNIYKVETVTNVDAATVKVACNVQSYASGIVTATTYAGVSKGAALGYYSWGKLTNINRSITAPKVFNINNMNGYIGITTSPEVKRINPLAVTYSDFDKTT